jgi:hypothetical protein
LSEALNADLEGKKLRIMILDSGIETESAIERSAKVQRFLDHAKTFSFDLPSAYQFDREELYDLRLLNPFL